MRSRHFCLRYFSTFETWTICLYILFNLYAFCRCGQVNGLDIDNPKSHLAISADSRDQLEADYTEGADNTVDRSHRELHQMTYFPTKDSTESSGNRPLGISTDTIKKSRDTRNSKDKNFRPKKLERGRAVEYVVGEFQKSNNFSEDGVDDHVTTFWFVTEETGECLVHITLNYLFTATSRHFRLDPFVTQSTSFSANAYASRLYKGGVENCFRIIATLPILLQVRYQIRSQGGPISSGFYVPSPLTTLPKVYQVMFISIKPISFISVTIPKLTDNKVSPVYDIEIRPTAPIYDEFSRKTYPANIDRNMKKGMLSAVNVPECAIRTLDIRYYHSDGDLTGSILRCKCLFLAITGAAQAKDHYFTDLYLDQTDNTSQPIGVRYVHIGHYPYLDIDRVKTYVKIACLKNGTVVWKNYKEKFICYHSLEVAIEKSYEPAIFHSDTDVIQVVSVTHKGGQLMSFTALMHSGQFGSRYMWNIDHEVGHTYARIVILREQFLGLRIDQVLVKRNASDDSEVEDYLVVTRHLNLARKAIIIHHDHWVNFGLYILAYKSMPRKWVAYQSRVMNSRTLAENNQSRQCSIHCQKEECHLVGENDYICGLCQAGYYGDNCLPCVQGFYGPDCRESCPKSCRKACIADSGECEPAVKNKTVTVKTLIYYILPTNFAMLFIVLTNIDIVLLLLFFAQLHYRCQNTDVDMSDDAPVISPALQKQEVKEEDMFTEVTSVMGSEAITSDAQSEMSYDTAI